MEEHGLVRGVDGAGGRGWGGLERSSLRPLDKGEQSSKERKKARRKAARESRRIAENKVVQDWMDVLEEDDGEKQGELRRSKRIAESNLKVVNEDEVVVGDVNGNRGGDDKPDYIPLSNEEDVGISLVEADTVDEDMDTKGSDGDNHDYSPGVMGKAQEKDNQVEIQHEQMGRSDKDNDVHMLSVICNEEANDNRTEIVDLTMNMGQSEEDDDDDCTTTLVINRTKSPDRNRIDNEVAVGNIIHEYDYDYRPIIDRKKRVEESWIELGMVLKDELLWCDPRDHFDEDLLP